MQPTRRRGSRRSSVKEINVEQERGMVGLEDALLHSEKDRHIVYCLRCEKPQDTLSTHLARVCMKNSTPEERQAELQRAEENTKNWTRDRRVWDYAEMCKLYTNTALRLILLKDLRRKGFFIANAPQDTDTEVIDQSSTSTPIKQVLPPTSGSTEEAGEGAAETSDSGSSDKANPTWQKPTILRMKMKKMGLYAKFPPETALLAQFKDYLKNTLLVTKCQQEVDNVSRILRYIQPTGKEVHLDFLTKSKEAITFIRELNSVKMSPSTIINYIKSMIRFIEHLKLDLKLAKKDQAFHNNCQKYIDILKTLRKPVLKSLCTDTVRKRYDWFIGDKQTLHDCQRVLRVTMKDMLGIYGKLLERKHVDKKQKTLFRYYCEGILILKHFQRPGAVQGMTTSEWFNKRLHHGRVCVGVREHKTATMQIATFALTKEEASFLDHYYLEIRSGYLKDGVDDRDKFFLSISGRPVSSATNDLRRLHEHYKLPNIRSQVVRRVAGTEANENFSEEQKSAVAHYMAHSTEVAKTHYRMRTMEGVVATANLFSCLERSTSDESGNEGTSHRRKRARETADEDVKDFSTFLECFPVGVTGQPPTKKQRTDAGFLPGRVFYDKWRVAQYNQRAEYLLSQYSRHPPTVHKVAKIIGKEGWKGNHPRPEDIVAKWKPAKRVQMESDAGIISSVTKQSWLGLAIKDFGGSKGQGVVSTKAFPKGSIICDYHGKAGGRDLCIDAQTFPCECHPSVETMGRKINHSSKNWNLKPLHCLINFPEGARDVILFQAMKDISIRKELCFDYGVNRKSFRGGGLNLEWLDN
uniref:SET domain-containing protein n=2 Tax=Scophthalmus maximus TaxID=52904 RepID=A0A8D3CLM9_SCOMX